MKNWFDAEKQGLARLLERKGKEFVLFELIQNGWDAAGVTNLSKCSNSKGETGRCWFADSAKEGVLS